MKFILIADEDEKVASFFPLWEIALFVLVVVGVLYFLHPQDLLQKALAQKIPSPVTLSYLQAFSKKDPQNKQLLFALIVQEVGMGQFKQAENNMALLKKMDVSTTVESKDQLLWLEYLLLRDKTYKLKLNTSKRIAYLKILRNLAEKMADKPLTTEQLKILALDNLGMGKANIALKIYNQLMNNKALKTPADLAMGGNIAMQNNAHLDASKFYWAASLATTQIAEKKKYALEAIKDLWSGNLVNQALALANQLPPYLYHDRSTLLYLSKLALAANHPEIAEKYALEALLINTKKTNE